MENERALFKANEKNKRLDEQLKNSNAIYVKLQNRITHMEKENIEMKNLLKELEEEKKSISLKW